MNQAHDSFDELLKELEDTEEGASPDSLNKLLEELEGMERASPDSLDELQDMERAQPITKLTRHTFQKAWRGASDLQEIPNVCSYQGDRAIRRFMKETLRMA